MTEDSLKSLIEQTISFPVFDGQDSIIYPAATLELSSHPPGLIGDGRSVVRQSHADINLFCTDKASRDTAFSSLVNAIEQVSGVSVPEVETYYDKTAKKYRAVITFDFIPREEENNGL